MHRKNAPDRPGNAESHSKIDVLEQIIRQMEATAAQLKRFVEAEEVRTKIGDLSNPTYSIYAKAARERADKLAASLSKLKLELEVARDQNLSATVTSALVSAPLDF